MSKTVWVPHLFFSPMSRVGFDFLFFSFEQRALIYFVWFFLFENILTQKALPQSQIHFRNSISSPPPLVSLPSKRFASHNGFSPPPLYRCLLRLALICLLTSLLHCFYPFISVTSVPIMSSGAPVANVVTHSTGFGLLEHQEEWKVHGNHDSHPR